jgi:cell division protein FtsZ
LEDRPQSQERLAPRLDTPSPAATPLQSPAPKSEPMMSSAPKSSEEDLLEIPAFLRRQAN